MTTVESQKQFNPEHERVSSVACGNEVRKARKDYKKDKKNSEVFKPGLGFLSGKLPATAFTRACLELSSSDAAFRVIFSDTFIFYQCLSEFR